MRKRIRRTRIEECRLSDVALVGAEYEGEHRIRLTYDNGVTGVVDFGPIFENTIKTINCPDCEKEFRRYFDPALFKKFRFDFNFLHWDYKIGYNTQMLYDLCL